MRRLLVAGALLAAGCLPKVHLTLLEAADITVPEDVRTVALIDRSASPHREGAASAVEGAASLLLASPRFEAAMPSVEVGRGPEPLSREELAAVLGAAGAEAVLALEAFDTDSVVQVSAETRTETVDGHEISRTEFTADRGTKVEATWRLYDAEGHVLDYLAAAGTTDTWRATGATRELAQQGLPPLEEVVSELGWSTGTAYGRRISPWYADVVRDYFVEGDPRLGAAKLAVRSGDWQTAITLWNEVAHTGTPFARARAEYDLAVAFEVKGQYRRALAHAEEAARLEPSARIVRYRDALRALLPDRRELQERMKPVGGTQ